MKARLVLILALATIPAAGWAQSGLPSPLSGNAATAVAGEQSAAKNVLTVSLGASTHVDDNALNDNRYKITDAISNFSPSLAWSLSRKRWSLDTEYAPSLSYSLEVPRYNNLGHALSNQLSLQLARHVSLRLRNAFNRTSDPFGRLSQSQLVPSFGVLDGVNPALFGPPTLFTTEQTGLDLTYMPAAHTTLGVSGSYALNSYDDLIASALPNRDTHTAAGRVFLDQKLSPRQSVSVSYSYQVVTSAAYGRTASHSVLLFDNWTLSPKFSISMFAGPQYLVSHQTVLAILPLQSGWSWSAGGTVNWSGAKTGISGSAVRRTSDGGGLGGSVQMTDFSGNVTRKLGKKTNVSAFANYAINGSNRVQGFGTSLRYLSAGAGIDREIVRNFSMNVRYWYVHQTQDQLAALIPILADHNRVEIGIRYSFSHPLGR